VPNRRGGLPADLLSGGLFPVERVYKAPCQPQTIPAVHFASNTYQHAQHGHRVPQSGKRGTKRFTLPLSFISFIIFYLYIFFVLIIIRHYTTHASKYEIRIILNNDNG